MNIQQWKADVEQRHGIVLLDFYKKGCGPCKLMEPIVNSIETENPGVLVMKVDVEEHPIIAARYNVAAFPTFVVLKGGLIRTVIAGRVPAAVLREAVAKA